MTKKLLAFLFSMMLVLPMAGCGSARPDETVIKPAGTDGAAGIQTPAEEVRQDGERFEAVIILEGMEETVRYEHIRNDALGFEMDYDYESFVRCRESDCERFISVYGYPGDPGNYLEVTYIQADADAVSASMCEILSYEYDIIREQCVLDRAGSCIRIEATSYKDGSTPGILETVYIIPAPDGCRVASARYAFESAEGFGRRFGYIMNTLSVIERNGGQRDFG